MPRYTQYEFPHYSNDEGRRQSLAFLNANDVVPKQVVSGSEFFVEEDGEEVVLSVTEFTIGGWDGKSRIWHEGCCGSTHYAKSSVRYPLKARPEEFGFAAVAVDGEAV